MREYHRMHPWRLSEGGLFIPHAYWNMTETSLSWWDDVGFILNGRRIIVWWRHPRHVYWEQIESQAWEEAGDDPHDRWLFEGGTKNYKKVGKTGRRKMTLPLFRVALNPRFTRPFYAVPRTSAARIS